jgi:hypothetical protein
MWTKIHDSAVGLNVWRKSVNVVTAVWCQWSLPGILVAEAFLQSTWAICVRIFQGKLVSTKVVVNSQINVSFSPAPIWLSLSLLNLKYYLTYQKKFCLNKSFCLTMVLYFAIICVLECVKKNIKIICIFF